jgi:olefin beta-lactone synthetase
MNYPDAMISAPMFQSFATRLHENAAKFPEKPAFIIRKNKFSWKTITYRQLAERSDQLLRGLIALNLQPGTRVVLMTPPSADFFALVFALLDLGIVPIMIDPGIGLRNVAICLEVAQPEAYFGSLLTQAIRVLCGWGRNSLQVKLGISDVLSAAKANNLSLSSNKYFSSTNLFQSNGFLQKDICHTLPLEAEAAIIYTSGSTGLPKGVIFSQANFKAQIEMLYNALHLKGNEIDLPAFPLFALIDCLLGVTAVIPDMRFPRPSKVDPANIVDAIQTHHVDTMFVSPAALVRITHYGRSQKLNLASLKKVITAGAPTPAEVQEQFISLLAPEAELFGIYGSTETLPVTFINSREVLSETRYLSEQGAGVCLGSPVIGAHVRIIPISDDAIPEWSESLEVPTGTVGEITVKGGAVTERYVGNRQASCLAKICDIDGKIIHRMGDLGYFDSQGRLWYCGRKSHRIVTPNGTLYTESVEGIFNAHPNIYRTALVGVDRTGSVEPVLWVELNPADRHINQNRLIIELLKLAQAHEMTNAIKTILFHPAFPTDVRHNSKIIREDLADQAKTRLK